MAAITWREQDRSVLREVSECVLAGAEEDSKDSPLFYSDASMNHYLLESIGVVERGSRDPKWGLREREREKGGEERTATRLKSE